MHIHMNPIGGIAGDMFIAAALDLFPDLENSLYEAICEVPVLARIRPRLEHHSDSILTGRKFDFLDVDADPHMHVSHKQLQAHLLDSDLKDTVRDSAAAMIDLLARAEAVVHGKELDEVVLHEVGSADSLADIVAVAFLLDAMPVDSFSCDPVPLGQGTVQTAHGELPLPAPAVNELLRGYPAYMDGRNGERVTPTGAAILRFIQPQFEPVRRNMTLKGSGTGFGTRRLDGISNILRMLVFSEEREHSLKSRAVAVLKFEIDDQTAEDLSVGLENVRRHKSVLDVAQVPMFGKKGRVITHVQILCKHEYLREVIELAMSETSTLGLRCQITDRYELDRKFVAKDLDESNVTLKVVQRPDQTITAKTESDHLQQFGGYGNRKSMKQRAEILAEKELNPGLANENE